MAFIKRSKTEPTQPTAFATLVNIATSTPFRGMLLAALTAFAPFLSLAAADSSGPSFTRSSESPAFTATGTTAPAVIAIQDAKRELDGLTEFRSGQTPSRRGGSVLDAVRSSAPTPPSGGGGSFADAIRGNSGSVTATVTTGGSSTTTTTTTSTSTSAGAGQSVELLTRRKTELQAEVSRWSRAYDEWQARYDPAKAELARIESDTEAQAKLDAAREELAKLNADIAAAEAASAPALTASAAAAPDTFGSFNSTASDFSSTPASTGNFADAIAGGANAHSHAGHAAAPAVSSASLAYQSQMADVLEKQQAKLRELEGIEQGIRQAQREQAMADRTDQRDQSADLGRQLQELNIRHQQASAELAQVRQQMQSLGDTANAAIPVHHTPPKGLSGMRGGNADLIMVGGPGAHAGHAGHAAGGGDIVTGGALPGINPGDKVQVAVKEDPTFGGTFEVNQSGSIMLPGIGTVNLLGQSESGAADQIREKLEGVVLVNASVEVLHLPAPRKTQRIARTAAPIQEEKFTIIYLAGEFITPGPLRIPEDVVPTLLQTIIRSGGITPSGDLTRVKLLRIAEGVRALEEVNVAGVLSGELPPNDIELHPNDIIVIPPFAPVVYVTGNVERAGTLRLFQDETLTAYAAILRAGGFSRFANLRKCYVVRDLGNGEKVQIPVNIREVQKGQAPDVILQGKDIVVVPERFFSF